MNKLQSVLLEQVSDYLKLFKEEPTQNFLDKLNLLFFMWKEDNELFLSQYGLYKTAKCEVEKIMDAFDERYCLEVRILE